MTHLLPAIPMTLALLWLASVIHQVSTPMACLFLLITLPVLAYQVRADHNQQEEK